MDILLVEDDEIIQLLLVKVMKKRGHQVTRVSCAEEALKLLKERWFQLAFVDLGLPGMSGLELSRSMRKLPDGDNYYIIVGTGKTGSENLDTILDAGADDYIPKPYQISQLDVRLAVAEKRVQEIEERARLEKELTFLAKHDPLTRLLNRWQLDEGIDSATRMLEQTGQRGSLMLIDLDHFKEVNDACGHQAGDRLLLGVADVLRNELPTDSIVIRFGGDEFVAVLPGTTAPLAVEIAEAVSEKISALNLPEIPDLIRPTASIGLTSIREHVEPRDLLKEADMACYRAKSLGKNRAEVFVRFNEKLLTPRTRQDLKTSQTKRGQDDELQLWFQPVVDLEDGSILYQEALLRFLSSRGQDAIQASMFMSQMNDRSYIRSLDRFVVSEICNSLLEYPYLNASININALSVTDWGFAETLLNLLEEYSLDGHRLFLEITETQAIKDLPLAQAIIRRLREAGIRFALDDLGAGFSSIIVLKTLPIELVKIDGSLIRNLPEEVFNQTFMHALKVFSNGVGFLTVAERLEKVEEMSAAIHHGVHYGQGFLLGRPRRVPYEASEIDMKLFSKSSKGTEK